MLSGKRHLREYITLTMLVTEIHQFKKIYLRIFKLI